jgi:hypothetical protein
VKGAEGLLEPLLAPRERLIAGQAAAAKTVEIEEDARDDEDLRGREGADMLRTTSERAKQYDRDAPGEAVFDKLFPEGGFSDFLASDGTASAATLRLFSKRVADLGTSHTLAALAPEHEKRATAIDAAAKAIEDAVKARKLAEAEEELAQAAVRKAYSDNYLDAQKKLGKVLAERLFPRIRRRGGGGGEVDENNKT